MYIRTHTRNNITRVHRITVLDETKAVHELDLRNLAGAMLLEMFFDVGLGSYKVLGFVQTNPVARSMLLRSCRTVHHSKAMRD